jgi:S-adenosylhomocysteine hydrolase
MKYEEFKKVLKKNNLTIKKFSELANISYATCNNWSTKGSVSSWVKSWLHFYEKSLGMKDEEYQELRQLKESLQAVMGGTVK